MLSLRFSCLPGHKFVTGFGMFVLAALVGCATTETGPTELDRLFENCQISLKTSRIQRDACEAELDKSRFALQTLEAHSQERMTDCLTIRDLLDDRLSDTELALSRCNQSSAVAEENLARLKRREQEIRRNLEEQIEAQDVEVQLLMNQLSVRVLDNILFKSGSAEILPTGFKVLDEIASAIRDGGDIIRIEGHTDNVPIGPNLKFRYPSNWELAAMRAASVIRYLQFGQAIAAERLMLVSWSKYQPITANDDDRGRQRNRRVDIILSAAERY